ncbi:MAG: rhomboid family intramembrane serine protease [Bacteroidia bacterium]
MSDYFRQYRPAKHNLFPPVVLNLIIINVLLYFAKVTFMETQRIDFDALFGLHHPLAMGFRWWQPFTHLFMHGDSGHLISNMLGCWLFGHLLENAFGPKRFILYYVVCGMGASAIFLGWETWSVWKSLQAAGYNADDFNVFLQRWNLNLIGASGALFGLIMGAALLFPNSTLPVYSIIPIKLKYIAIIYGLAELYRGVKVQGGDNVAHFAHLGGMIFGFILIKLYNRNRTHFY